MKGLDRSTSTVVESHNPTKFRQPFIRWGPSTIGSWQVGPEAVVSTSTSFRQVSSLGARVPGPMQGSLTNFPLEPKNVLSTVCIVCEFSSGSVGSHECFYRGYPFPPPTSLVSLIPQEFPN